MPRSRPRAGQARRQADCHRYPRIESVRSARLFSLFLSVAGISLLSPRIAAVVIAADFPIAGLVLGQEFDGLQPLRALPEIEMRHDEAHRAAMLDVERLAGP